MSESDDARRIEELTARIDALSTWVESQADRIEELEADNRSLRRAIADVERVVSPDPTATDYESMDRADRVRTLREGIVQMAATDRTGKASMGYREVKSLFRGRPSNGYCYTLMELAGEADGFAYGSAPDGGRRLTVDVAAIDGTKYATPVDDAVKA